MFVSLYNMELNPTTGGIDRTFLDQDRPDTPAVDSPMERWRQANDMYKPLMQQFDVAGFQDVDGVDFLVPSFYTWGPDYNAWIQWTQSHMLEYRRFSDEFNLPVYPFVMPQDMEAEPIEYSPVAMGRFELELLRSLADGVAVWYGPNTTGYPPFEHLNPYNDEYDGDPNFENTQPFYQEM